MYQLRSNPQKHFHADMKICPLITVQIVNGVHVKTEHSYIPANRVNTATEPLARAANTRPFT